MPDPDQDAPYQPKYKGFDAERTRRAVETAERAKEGAGAQGEDANREYVDEGPREAAERMGASSADERAAKKKRP
jgi:hypothetical protein